MMVKLICNLYKLCKNKLQQIKIKQLQLLYSIIILLYDEWEGKKSSHLSLNGSNLWN